MATRSPKLLPRAMLAFLALPGTVAFAVPIFMLWLGESASLVGPLGLIPLGLGIVLLLWCVREFYVAGRGTLAPWAPPEKLVISGPYRFSRNPMYIAVGLVLCGWAIAFRSLPLAVYAAVVVLAFHLRVVLYEEPYLARSHGEAWTRYKARVPRWIGIRS